MKTGMSSNIERKSKKQIKDTKDRNVRLAKIAYRNVGRYLGKHKCKCSKCQNTVTLTEPLNDRKIQCSKCQNGFYESINKKVKK